MTARFDISMGDMSSSTYFSFNNTGSLEYDNGDASNSLPLQASNHIEIMTYADNIPLKINNLPFEIGTALIPMDIMILDVDDESYFSESGEVIFSWDTQQISSRMDTRILDNATGETINLSTLPSIGYNVFQINGGDNFPAQTTSVNDTYPMLETPRFHIIFEQSTVVNVNDKNLPHYLSIDQIYPNPFNPSVTIDYYLSKDSDINISVYDLKGAMVDRLFKGKMVSGYHQIDWVPTNISSGIYFIKIKSNGRTINRKVTFLK